MVSLYHFEGDIKKKRQPRETPMMVPVVVLYSFPWPMATVLCLRPAPSDSG